MLFSSYAVATITEHLTPNSNRESVAQPSVVEDTAVAKSCLNASLQLPPLRPTTVSDYTEEKKHMNRIQVGKHTERQYPINVDQYQHLRSQQNEASRLAVVHSKTRGHLKLILYQHCRFRTSTQCNNISYGYNIAGYFSEMSAADLLSLYTVIAMDDHAGWAKKIAAATVSDFMCILKSPNQSVQF